jgi:hypothetical protein
MEQHEARLFPVALDRAFGGASVCCDIVNCIAAEKFQVHQLGEEWISRGQLIESVGEPREFGVIESDRFHFGGQLRDVKGRAALDRAPLANEVDEESAHDARGVPHESRSVRKDGRFPGHAEIRLMEERRRTHRHTGVAPQLPFGQRPQFAIERHKKAPTLGAFDCVRVLKWKRTLFRFHPWCPWKQRRQHADLRLDSQRPVGAAALGVAPLTVPGRSRAAPHHGAGNLALLPRQFRSIERGLPFAIRGYDAPARRSDRMETQVNTTSKSIIKKAAGLALVGVALALSLPADAKLAANSRQSNRLAANRLSGNRLSGNRLAANALATNQRAGDGAFTDIAAVELPNGMRFAR